MGVCSICRKDAVRRWSDYLDGHTLMEATEDCENCGHHYTFATGNSSEIIGRWSADWTYTEDRETELARIAAREVAIFIRRHELGLTPPEVAGFAAALAASPDDFDAAKVYADWLDERGGEMDEAAADRFRRYADASGFVCRHCGGVGETYTHSSDCDFRFCALAGGPEDCRGEVVPCECRAATATEDGDHETAPWVTCLDCNGSGERGCGECNGTGEVEPCCVCGKASRTLYADREDCPSCGSAACELRMQTGMDYHDDVGHR